MTRITPEQRRDALRNRTKRAVKEKNNKDFGISSVLDYSKCNKTTRTIERFKIDHKNKIDIIPFEITNPKYKNLKSISGKILGEYSDVGFLDYKLEVPVHRNIGENNEVFLCLKHAFGKKCPICEELYEEWDKDEDEQDKKKISALKWSWRTFYNVYNHNDEKKGIQLWDNFSWFWFEKILQEAVDDEEEIITFSDLESGAAIKFKGGVETFKGKNFFKPHSITFEERESYSEDILNNVFPLDKMLIIPTYEQVANAHFGIKNDKEIQEEVEEEIKEEVKKESQDKKPTISSRKRFSNNNGKNECPEGKEFGVDCNACEECEECEEDIFQKCITRQEELKKEKENKPSKPHRRSRTPVEDESDVPF